MRPDAREMRGWEVLFANSEPESEIPKMVRDSSLRDR